MNHSMTIRLLAFAMIAFFTTALHAQQTTNQSDDAIKRLMPSFGRVVQLNNPIIKDGRVDAALMELTDKIENLLREVLGVGTASNSFSRLPEVVQRVKSWKSRPDYFDLTPEISVALREVHKSLGKEDSTVNDGAGFIWHRYGVYGFGVTNDVVAVVRLNFTGASSMTEIDKAKK
jgi:hypothetical protein